LLYGLRPDLWGRGLAEEAARTAIAWLFDTQPITRVLAGTSASNERSLQLLARLGFEPMRERPAGPPTIDYYGLSRERFAR
jgi:[ribosomal protein S5]-alanine N-acetyltransferase